MIHDINDKDFEHYLYTNLERVFGRQKTIQIIHKIKSHKKNHPNQAFSYIFDENGEFKAIKK